METSNTILFSIFKCEFEHSAVKFTYFLFGRQMSSNSLSVAEVQFQTDAENRNWPNRTDSSVQVQFSLATPVVSSVLGSHISRNLRTGSEPVRMGPNRKKITGWCWVTSDSGWMTSTSPITYPVSQTPRPP
jgi:hypothetical protein